jgi:F0F1-type ATP synthase epsilon subunit
MLSLMILSPDRVVLSVDDVTKVRLRLADAAWLSIYPQHAPLIAETRGGVVQYDTAYESGEIDVAAGILYVNSERVTVLTSGLQHERTPDARDLGADATDDARFDRLATRLRHALKAQSVAEATETSADGS